MYYAADERWDATACELRALVVPHREGETGNVTCACDTDGMIAVSYTRPFGCVTAPPPEKRASATLPQSAVSERNSNTAHTGTPVGGVGRPLAAERWETRQAPVPPR